MMSVMASTAVITATSACGRPATTNAPEPDRSQERSRIGGPDAADGATARHIEVTVAVNAPGHTELSFAVRGRARPVVARLTQRDAADRARLAALSWIGEIDDRAVIVSDEYPSRPGNPGAYCGAGTESFVRVFAIDAAGAEETLRIPRESCFYNIQSSAPEWDPRTRTLSLEVHAVPGDGGDVIDERREVHLAEDGRVERTIARPIDGSTR
jgi:hypothetical protein